MAFVRSVTKNNFFVLKMSEFISKKQHLREVLLHYFILKKSDVETHFCRLLVDIYGEHAPSKTNCKEWFRRFNSDDFDVRDKEREGAPKDAELQALLEKIRVYRSIGWQKS